MRSTFVAICATLAVLGGQHLQAESYYTTGFPNVENPIREVDLASGLPHWQHLYPLGQYNATNAFAQIKSMGGYAIGLQTGGSISDSYTYLNPALTPFVADQMAQGTLWVAPGTSDGEWEILLRVSDDTSHLRLYECNLQVLGGYAEIVSWHFPGNQGIGDEGYTYLAHVDRFDAGLMPPRAKDILKATIVGNEIWSYLVRDGVEHLLAHTIDAAASHPSGQPGLATFINKGGNSSSFGFSSYTARHAPGHAAQSVGGPATAADTRHATARYPFDS